MRRHGIHKAILLIAACFVLCHAEGMTAYAEGDDDFFLGGGYKV